MEGPAEYYAARLQQLHPLRQPARLRELRAALEARGIPVLDVSGLSLPALCVEEPGLYIARRPETDESVLAHEGFHGITRDNVAHGIDPPREWEDCDPEQEADRFSELLTTAPQGARSVALLQVARRSGIPLPRRRYGRGGVCLDCRTGELVIREL